MGNISVALLLILTLSLVSGSSHYVNIANNLDQLNKKWPSFVTITLALVD